LAEINLARLVKGRNACITLKLMYSSPVMGFNFKCGFCTQYTCVCMLSVCQSVRSSHSRVAV